MIDVHMRHEIDSPPYRPHPSTDQHAAWEIAEEDPMQEDGYGYESCKFCHVDVWTITNIQEGKRRVTHLSRCAWWRLRRSLGMGVVYTGWNSHTEHRCATETKT